MEVGNEVNGTECMSDAKARIGWLQVTAVRSVHRSWVKFRLRVTAEVTLVSMVLSSHLRTGQLQY